MLRTFLLFDFDGTISDPLEGIGRSINYALEAYGYPSYRLSARSRRPIPASPGDTFVIIQVLGEHFYLAECTVRVTSI